MIVGVITFGTGMVFIRLTHPIMTTFFDLWTAGFSKTLAQVIYYLGVFFIIYMVVMAKMTSHQTIKANQEADQ